MIKKLINKIGAKFRLDHYGGMLAGFFVLGVMGIIFFPFYLPGDIYNHFKWKKQDKERLKNWKPGVYVPEPGTNKDRPVIKYRIHNNEE